MNTAFRIRKLRFTKDVYKRQVLKWKGPEIEDAEIEISISELPEATGDKDLITNLLKHLISNAVKFRNKGRKAIIDIGHNKSEGQVIFCVRDNGIGISKKHHEEVFNLFFSLNAVSYTHLLAKLLPFL